MSEIRQLKAELAQAREELAGCNNAGYAVVKALTRAEAERDRALAVVEAVKTYRQAAADAGNPMWPWPALEIALAVFDAAQQEDTA